MPPTNQPGQPDIPEGLTARLSQALAAKGVGYQPRTHHLMDGGAPRFTNRLVLETSPYLLQHAHNPVNWYPWGDEAFADARRLGRPVFLSIGYSTCHWCHVMEGESFEDTEIAEVLNTQFIAIKVDREERPDVDAVYMAAVQSLTGSGGWPMSVFLTAEREPFFAGTYFPARDGERGARMGFLTLLRELRKTFDKDPERVQQAAASLCDAIRQNMEGVASSSTAAAPDRAVIDQTVATLSRVFDRTHGGLRRAPKFPSNIPVRLLLRHHHLTGDQDALHMATFTLEKMAAGGLYDQLGGGFHRYSTDEQWLAPHFEKMLYDNALLAVAYAEAHQLTGRADFARVLRETLDYVLREMTAPDGAFYSATDADSEGEEGKFFVWSKAEVEEALGPQAAAFCQHYDVTEAGNWEGTNILRVLRPDEAAWAALTEARRTLYQRRALRPAPLRDDKILAAWNGLMISALSVGGRVLGSSRYVEAAARSGTFILDRMRSNGRILRSYKDGQVLPVGFLEDQAFVVAGLLDLYEASFERRWLEAALSLADATQALFADEQAGGWFMTARDGERLLAREKPAYDGAEPSGTSVAILNALRLSAFTGEDRWRQIAERAFASLHTRLQDAPLVLTETLVALSFARDVPREVGLVWPANQGPEAAQPLLDVLRRTFVPHRVLAAAAEDELPALAQTARFMEGKRAVDARPTAYVCERGRCDVPTTDPVTFAAQLAARRP